MKKCCFCGKLKPAYKTFRFNKSTRGWCGAPNVRRVEYTHWCKECYEGEELRAKQAIQDSCQALKDHAEKMGIDTSSW